VDRRVVGVGVGGDHSVTLAELRALAKVHGPLGLVHLDSHSDLWDSYFGKPYSHGTMFRRAIEEGIIEPARVIHAGMGGPLYAASDDDIPEELGVELVPWVELATLSGAEFAERARRRTGTGPAS
jgi:agmatinase